MYPEARPQVGHLAVVGRGVTSMVTPSGLGNTRLTWSALGTNDSKREDTSRHHGREPRSLPDPATSYKPDQHANCRRTPNAEPIHNRWHRPRRDDTARAAGGRVADPVRAMVAAARGPARRDTAHAQAVAWG